jgi:hypothetical protein
LSTVINTTHDFFHVVRLFLIHRLHATREASSFGRLDNFLRRNTGQSCCCWCRHLNLCDEFSWYLTAVFTHVILQKGKIDFLNLRRCFTVTFYSRNIFLLNFVSH